MNQDIHLDQQRFGESIRTPLLIDEDGGHAQPHYYDGELLRGLESQPKLNMAPADRLAIYNQQYWFRLITTFQEEYPLTLAFCGLDEFNGLVMSYLDEYPSQSPYLRYLSQNFVAWLERQAVDLRVVEVAKLDFIFIELFDAPSANSDAPLDPESISLRPTIRLYHEQYPWVAHRSQRNESKEFHEALKELTPQESYWMIERTQRFSMKRTQLSKPQYQLLSLCQKHHSIPKAVDDFCETILGEQEHIDDQPAQQWFQDSFKQWGTKSWFIPRD